MPTNMDNWRRSGQIPAFGDWDYTNQMPITQYFECPRQAGLFGYSSSGECDHQYMNNGDLYAVEFKKKTSRDLAPPRKTKGGERNVEKQRKQEKKKVCDATELPRKQSHQQRHKIVSNNNKKISVEVINRQRLSVRPPKPVDEDLYKIPPELLLSSKRKRKMGLFSCLVPACAS
ncbi:uncharacterized protein LOC119993052 [Tripterygium wilfordii]|uniref:uncharacterized protein LOC119993052 n=1 Tax=Tripterygium wilfordii TaxID=458696 RepID=UPI0018F83058|nr:uncharacterized protein LOC119993052 [Tripterygium wilfordii]